MKGGVLIKKPIDKRVDGSTSPIMLFGLYLEQIWEAFFKVDARVLGRSPVGNDSGTKSDWVVRMKTVGEGNVDRLPS